MMPLTVRKGEPDHISVKFSGTMARTYLWPIRLVQFGLIVAAGTVPIGVFAQQSPAPALFEGYSFRMNQSALVVSTDGGPVLAFGNTREYCKYVQHLLENAGANSPSMTRLADGFASKVQSGSPITIIAPQEQDCDGARVEFYKVHVKTAALSRSHRPSPVYILRGYVKPLALNRGS
jgi:hypothetical protein